MSPFFIRGKDVSPEMPINRGMEGKGEGSEGSERDIDISGTIFRRGLSGIWVDDLFS